MTNPKYADFSAADSMLGYIYQCEYALYYLLDRDHNPAQISIETLDDIVSGDISDPQALLQLKLHAVNGDGAVRSLTDRSPDLWKTLRIWATYIREDRVDPTKTTFFLLTTSPLGVQHGVGHLLGPPKSMPVRDINAAKAALEQLAGEILADAQLDPSGPLVKGASAFLALKPAQRLDLVRNIVIVTGTPSITELRKGIDKRLRASGSTTASHEQFVETILGWWYRLCVEQIADKSGRTITFEALERKMAETAKSLAIENLPRYHALEHPTDAELAAFAGWLFVRQLVALGLRPDNPLIAAAVVDYYKADGHRKRWLEDLRLDQQELAAFEGDLNSIWATNFGLAEAEVPDCEASADPRPALEKLGRRVLQQTLTAKCPTLKGFDGEYLGRGTYHIMANRSLSGSVDEPSIGWHPHWKRLFTSGGSA